jgi:septum formation protein
MLLEWAEVPFEVVSKTTDESYPEDMQVEEIPIHIARNKAITVDQYLDGAFHQQHSKKTILAADTIVVLEKQIINKPHSRTEAIEMLELLSGKTHRVITGVVLLHNSGEVAFAEVTEVTFDDITREQIEYYVDKFEPYDKAGAYAIQEWIGVMGIKSINGDFYNVMGLPVSRVLKELNKLHS